MQARDDTAKRSTDSAFTLIELLTTISIVSILSALALSSVYNVKSSARNMSCRNNLKQMAIGSAMYASDDRRGALSNTTSDGDDNQNWLFPMYVPALKSFSCPNTLNVVRSDVKEGNGLLDLSRRAPDTKGYGSSYEVFGYMNYNGDSSTEIRINGNLTNVPGIQKTESTVSAYVHQNVQLGLRGMSPGPSRIWLMLDEDASAGNYPTRTSNHGSAGINVQFCDGHVEQVLRRQWLLSYELSQDEGREYP